MIRIYTRRLATASNGWTKDSISKVYNTPLMELVYQSASVHRAHHDPTQIQLCTLLNIKSGGCSEDCSYCSQSSRYTTTSPVTKLMSGDDVLKKAREAKENGSTRFCMGAAWREMHGRKTNMKKICEMVTEINAMGMEVCTTLGMLDASQAKQLKEAGLTAYNHNIDTSREFYPTVITTRGFDDRLATIESVKNAGLKVCTGGILGLGETSEDRVSFLQIFQCGSSYFVRFTFYQHFVQCPRKEPEFIVYPLPLPTNVAQLQSVVVALHTHVGHGKREYKDFGTDCQEDHLMLER